MIASRSPIFSLFILINIFVSSPLYASIYDVDQNDIEDALTDGLLILRHEFGIDGANLTDGALAPNAALTNPESIASYINDRSLLFDLDGNRSNDALTDGLLLLLPAPAHRPEQARRHAQAVGCVLPARHDPRESSREGTGANRQDN